MQKICIHKGFKLVDTPTQWDEGTKEKRNKYKPKIKCSCGNVVESTSIHGFVNDSQLGCTKCFMRAWEYRRAEFVTVCISKGCKCLDTPKQWEAGTRVLGAHYTPIIECSCGNPVNTTSINNFVNGNKLGCTKCFMGVPWEYRYEEFVKVCTSKGCKFLDTQKEWEAGTRVLGAYYTPKIECSCGNPVNTTSINNFVNNNELGCTNCRNKTEPILHEWLKMRLSKNAIITLQFPGPGRKKFDFHTKFIDGTEMIFELDGAWHFVPFQNKQDETSLDDFKNAMLRDLEKEEWATAKKIPILRVLQEDVWFDQNDWAGYFKRNINGILDGIIK